MGSEVSAFSQIAYEMADGVATITIYELGQGPDTAEGVRSFLEKRPPKFTARIDDFTGILPEWPQRPEDMA